MSKRVGIEPKAYEAMMGFEKYLETTDISPIHAEMIRIRASQINGCAFCINMHTKDARKAGETEQRIYLLNAWRETSLYTPEERAILALTEEVTLISGHGVSDKTYEEAEALLGRKYLSQVLAAIIVINAWNRLAISSRMQPAD
ncbi:carboxymuconolactone decarboxylase family protein [Mucilaginibacter ginsenosidivorans]|uniref:Carboxymuconolactone decarboxylase family protein n=1 Tax=Mucilaginibacter ginsenosidivorans TaxID=398053 RepID=A0A5B8UZA7_9SPHI|nr:carboxymuconolactone decarboxylase family protein [Mucilaginibacter ginsenosidivorans]QEC63646.1 carboxymuconolactone decarboxylase family protein [Mucilaginibacter ginsenosidivorans]